MIHYISCECLSINGDDAILEIKYRVDGGKEIFEYQIKQDFSVEGGFIYIGTSEVLNGHRPGTEKYASDHDLMVDKLQDHFGYE